MDIVDDKLLGSVVIKTINVTGHDGSGHLALAVLQQVTHLQTGAIVVVLAKSGFTFFFCLDKGGKTSFFLSLHASAIHTATIYY